MRVGVVSALSVLLPLIYSPRPAPAQSNPASTPSVEQALDSTLVMLKEGRAPQSHLSQELAHVMMRLAENNHQPPWPVVASFADKLTRDLIGRQLNNAQTTAMRECIVEAMHRTGTSNAGLASRLQQTLLGIGIDSSKTQLVIRAFIAVREAVQGPDDSPLVKPSPFVKPRR